MEVSRSNGAQRSEMQAVQRRTELRNQAEQEATAKTQAQATEKPKEPPRPVVNSQGQTTGRLLNVSA